MEDRLVAEIIIKKIEGELDHDRVMRLVRELAVDAASYPDRNILIDYRQTTATDKSMLDIMKISSEIKSFQYFFTNRVATVIPPEENRYAVANKMKACLVIMGFHYEVFTDYDQALAWLAEG
ncbi:MAG: STAS/SEC14 domain-containing protein [Desulfobacterales bacterium]|nr:STAS/SEC14 domain-containing protein [Desulfobacterales bacterium]